MLYRKYIKRILDVVLSLCALIVLFFPMAIVALLVKIKLGSPVIFTQDRTGENNKDFKLLKFRTMTEEKDSNGIYLPDSVRLTKFGKFLRTMSIDELPSLINILKGEMSIIGPRPLPVRYLERYSKKHIRRHEVKPGLSNTGVINGRNAQSWEEQFDEDVWYVDNISFWVDIKCIFMTIKIVISKEGATAENGDCRREFIGVADINSLKGDTKNYMKLN